jgi:hypothetical protein
MNKFLPAGRLSKVEEDGVVIQVQTEFSWRPHPRIATSVSLDGVVIHKVQKDWQDPVETESQQTAVERFINRQHDEVISIIESQKQQLVSGQRSGTVAGVLQDIMSESGVNGAWCLTDKGIISPDSGGRELLPEYKGIFEGLISLCSFLTSITSVGEVIDGEIVLQDELLLIVRRNVRCFIVGYDREQEPTELLGRVNAILERA